MNFLRGDSGTSMLHFDNSLWQSIIGEVFEEGGNITAPWFSQLEPLSLEHGLLEILCPGQRERDYCRQHVSRLFAEATQKVTGKLVGVCFLAPADAEKIPETGSDDGLPEIAEEKDTANPYGYYTFDNFINGPSNRLAHAACLAVSESPGMAYNPLFIHGSSGLGKTHLLNAICNTISGKCGRENVRYLTCEEFVNNFIRSVQEGKLSDFRYRYRHVDLLAIDDIQFLNGHEQSQEEFFHTFNTLFQARKQVVLSSDRGPSETSLEERLVSRFNWGLVAQIDFPCYETRVAILKSKASQRGLVLPDEVACFIASSVNSHARELEGIISKLAILSEVMGTDITLPIAEESLDRKKAQVNREVTIDDILEAVTSRYNVRLGDLQSKRRTRSIVLPRQICMYLARNMTNHSLEEIGGYFGGRDHTTVLHASKVIQARREEDPHFHATITKISENIHNNA